MKKILLLTTLGLILTSCGGSSTNDNTQAFESEKFTVSVPKAWTHVEKTAIPAPKDGQVVLALTSPEVASGFANNMVIIGETLREKIDSKRYSIINYALTTGSYTDFIKLDEKTITFPDEDTANLYTFEAKYTTATPKQKFLQSAKVCGDTVYLITVGLGIGTTNVSRYEELITSFSCK